jgi:hypothetical protein
MMAFCIGMVVCEAPRLVRYLEPNAVIGGVELFVCGLVLVLVLALVLVLELARRRLPAKLLEWFVGRQ